MLNQYTGIVLTREVFGEGDPARNSFLWGVALAWLRVRLRALNCGFTSFSVVAFWGRGCGHKLLTLALWISHKTVANTATISVLPVIFIYDLIILTIDYGRWQILLHLKSIDIVGKVARFSRMLFLWAAPRSIAHFLFCVHCFAINLIACLLACLADRQLHPTLLFLDADGLILRRAIHFLVFMFTSTFCVQSLQFSDNFCLFVSIGGVWLQATLTR